tara:strand:+ start:7308 stop:7646 length:339 start_codon:yes stop_codon:yes gene_type:complete
MSNLIIKEADVQRQILVWLEYQRKDVPMFWRNNTGAIRLDKRFIRFGAVGSSDILGVMSDGRFLAIEVKSAKGKLTKHQKVFLDGIRDAGGVAFVARSIEDVAMGLKLHGRG